MYTNPYLVLNEKGVREDALFLFLFRFLTVRYLLPAYAKKETLFFSLSF
mgnify:CR=1 FL=1